MVSEWALGFIGGFSNLYGISAVSGVYFIALLFSLFFAMYVGTKTERIDMGIGTFIMFLFAFAFMDMFPFWIAMVTVIILVAVIIKMGEKGNV